MLKVIILDFDGVILESMDIKTNAFRELFKDYPEYLDSIIDYHLMYGGMSRYTKISYIFDNILRQPIDEKELNELGKKFSQLVLYKILRCPFVPGVQDFLEEYSKRMKFFIASGAPEGELRFIVKERGLSCFFKGVYGAPTLKPEIIKRILDKEDIEQQDALFVGDELSDYRDAKKARIPFVARFNGSNELNPFLNLRVPVIHNFNDLEILFSKGMEEIQ